MNNINNMHFSYFSPQVPIQRYVEFPKDLAFSIIDKLAKDCSHAGINLLTSNQDLKEAYFTRYEELNLTEHIYYLILRFFYGGQSATCFIVKEDKIEDYKIPINDNNLNKLLKINSLSFLTYTTPIWFFVKEVVKSPFSILYDEPFLQIGGEFPDYSRYYGIYENKQPLYLTLKQVTGIIEKIADGIDITGERFATLLKKDSQVNHLNSQLNNALRNQFTSVVDQMNNRSGIIIGDTEELTNMGMNLNGVDSAMSSLFYIVSVLTGIPQNILLGKGQGVSASATEDFRQYALIINYYQERYIRPFINRVNALLFHSKKDELYQYREESVSFEFNPIKPQSEEEAGRATNQNIQNMKALVDLGFKVDEVVSLDKTVSSLIKENQGEENEDR